MTEPRLSQVWHRAGPTAALCALLGATAFASTEGCGGEGTGGSGGSTGTTMTTTTTTTATTTTGTGGSGGTGTGGGGGAQGPLTPSPAADVHSAFDATPDPEGLEIYFTAVDPVDGAGVFKAKADGSDPMPTKVKVGDPFVSPFGIAIGFDGKQLYIADPGAVGANDKGQIFVLPVGGGSPSGLAGTEDYLPRGLELAQVDQKDVVFFSGNDPVDGKPGVFKVPATGGAAQPVSKDALFRDPAGLAVAKNGDVYVADTIAAGSGAASILVVTSNGAASELVTDIRVGYPAGVSLTLDEKTLLVSGLDPITRKDVLISIDLATKKLTLFSDVIGEFTESAGLHRAKNVNLFAWADSSAGPAGGRVYVVK